MSHRKYLTAAATAAAVIGLSACGTSTGDAHSASTGQTQQQSTPDETRDAPPTPLPETDDNDDVDDMFDEAYLDALDEEGIDLDDDTALDTADLVCELDEQGEGFVTVTNRVATETGLDDEDSGYVYGAAIVTCGIDGGDA